MDNHTFHVAFVATTGPAAGGEFHYTHSLARALAVSNAADIRVSLVTTGEAVAGLSKAFSTTVVGKSGWRGCARSLTLKLPFGPRVWRAVGGRIGELERALQKVRPNLTIFGAASPLVLGLSGDFVAPIHDVMHIYEGEFPEVRGLGEVRRRQQINGHIARRARGILVDSEIGKQHVLRNYARTDERRVFVLPFAPPPHIHSQAAGRPPAASIPNRYIFYPAQLWRHKNHAGLLRAVSLLHAKGVAVNVVLVGADKNAGDQLRADVQRLGLEGSVVHLNYVNDEVVVWLYRHAVALVMPTFFGPTNIPPLEAFTLGCPVALSNVYGSKEQVGDAALLFDPKCDVDIAASIERLWTNESLRTELIRRGYARVAAWNRTTFERKFLTIVRELLPRDNFETPYSHIWRWD